MVNLRKTLLVSIAATATASLLLVGGCAPKDKGPDAQISVEAPPLGLSAPDEKIFARHFEVPKRDVSEEDAEKALEILGLQSEGVMSWDGKSGEAGNYVYTSLGAQAEENEITIGRAELIGVRTEGEEATFDRANFKDMLIKGDDINFKISAMSVARPTPKMAQAIMKALQTNEGFDDLNQKIDMDVDMSFGALSLDEITITAPELEGEIDQIVWGVDSETELGDGKVGAVNLTFNGTRDTKGTSSTPSKLIFSGASARAVNTQTFGSFSNMEGVGGLSQILGRMNAYTKPYENYTIGKGAFESETLTLSFDGFEGEATEKGGVTTITQVGKPIKFSFEKAPDNPQGAQAYQTLKQLGFDEVSLRTSQTQVLDKNNDTMRVEDGLVEMADGFRLNYTYEAEGLSAMKEAAMKEGIKTPAASGQSVEDVLSALEPVKLRKMKMSLEDQSIVERGLKLASEMTGQSSDNLKKQMKIAVMAAPFMAQNELESQVISEIGGAFVQFIDNGGTMTIAIDPPKPLSVKTLAQAREKNLNPDDIGFSASVKP